MLWGSPGRYLEAFWSPDNAVLDVREGLGSLLEAFRSLLEASWSLLDASWSLLEDFWESFG